MEVTEPIETMSDITQIPVAETITCFTDGACQAATGVACAGWMFIDSSGKELGGGYGAERDVLSPITTEALAIKSALHHALHLDYTNLQIKSDAHDLILAITRQEQIKEIDGLLKDINNLASMFTSISFSFIPRSENKLVKRKKMEDICEGGYGPIEDIKDHGVDVIAKFAVSEFNKQNNSKLKFHTVVSGELQVVSGVNFRLVLNVSDEEDGGCKTYEAEVYEQLYGDSMVLMYFKPVN
ncbi:unnamed protein product [Microthlaspi erraticum]|uniref:Cystatin domain-containing protein n=1 Tax=Microthlaspi erraticum TaxID=1685480 RepID=A0A6D2JU49_9BRAS|nr:unnamed protein product [Microthlaspi erraticum]